MAALIYFVSPADAMPDVIVGLGLLDDATVLGFTIPATHSDLEAFRKWEDEESPSPSEAPAAEKNP